MDKAIKTRDECNGGCAFVEKFEKLILRMEADGKGFSFYIILTK